MAAWRILLPISQPPSRGAHKQGQDQKQQLPHPQGRPQGAQGPALPGEQPLPGVQHVEGGEVPLTEDHQQVIADERGEVGHVPAAGDGGKQHAKGGPEAAGKGQQQHGGQQLPEEAPQAVRVQGLLLQGREGDQAGPGGQEQPQQQHQPPGHGAGQDLPPQVTAPAAPGQHKFEIAGFPVIQEAGGGGQGAEQRQEEGQAVPLYAVLEEPEGEARRLPLRLAERLRQGVRLGHKNQQGDQDHPQPETGSPAALAKTG